MDLFKIFRKKKVDPLDLDCGTKRGIEICVCRGGKIRPFIGRSIISQTGKLIKITDTNYKDFIGSTIYLRSPTTCDKVGTPCKVCAGKD